MKKLIISFLSCLGTVYGYAQNQNVGIGTGTPNASALLELSSSTKGILAPRMTTAQRTAIATPAPGLLVYDNSTTSFWYYKTNIWTELNPTIATAGIWQVSGANIYSPNTGNVGIGTSLPGEKLHITNGKIFIRDNRADQNPHVIFDIPALDWKEGGLQWKRSGDTLGAINYVANPNLPNYVRISMQNKGTSPDLTVNTNGFTGIGTVNPQVKLHIQSRSGIEVFRLQAEAPLLQFVRRTNADNIFPDVYKDIGFIQTSGDNLRMGTNSSNDGGKFVVRTNGADRIFVDASGNVSIGTEDVASGYKVSVLGKIICEEVKVQVKASWPDYVFKEDYPLMPLPELRSFIGLKGHLPNIPNAAEVQKSGMEMGEMQRRMIEKIEELTLYILSLQEQLDLLKNK